MFAAILVLASSWMVVAGIKKSTDQNVLARAHNGDVLTQAKQALIGYIVKDAVTNNNPGKLPCPESPSDAGGSNEGIAAGSCSLPAIGRLPWKTLGLRKLLDRSGEPLWYVVSANWANPSSGSISINSNTAGQLTVDDAAGAAVAMIVAPGTALNIQPNGNQTACTARNQSASRASLPPNYRDFLECQNNPAGTFVTTVADNVTNAVFNDQVVVLRVADFMPLVEGVVARRLATGAATAIQSMYSTASWGALSSAPVFPYAVPFGNPDSSTFQGTSGTTQGLLPVTFSTKSATAYCDQATDGLRCDPTFVKWVSFQSLVKQSGTMTLYGGPAPTCTVADAQISCTIYTNNSGTLNMTFIATASNVAMAMRQLDADAPALTGFSSGGTATATINSDGSSQVTYTGRVTSSPSLSFGCTGPSAFSCYRRTFTIPIRIFEDHPIVNNSDSEYGWFTTNEWHKVTYYATSTGHTANNVVPSCSSATNCLSVQDTHGVLRNPAVSSNGQRALMILAGRKLSVASTALASPTVCATASQASRPSASAADYLECVAGVINSDGDRAFIQDRVSGTFNDRVVLIDQNP